jgi:hypothetical protein
MVLGAQGDPDAAGGGEDEAHILADRGLGRGHRAIRNEFRTVTRYIIRGRYDA